MSPSMRCAREIRADAEALTSPDLDAAIDAADRLTDAELRAAQEGEQLGERSRWTCDLRTGARASRSAVEALGWAAEVPGLSEGACVVLGALSELGGPGSWLEVAVRLGAHPAAVERQHEPQLHAALDELLAKRLVRRLRDGRIECVGTARRAG